MSAEGHGCPCPTILGSQGTSKSEILAHIDSERVHPVLIFSIYLQVSKASIIIKMFRFRTGFKAGVVVKWQNVIISWGWLWLLLERL